MAKTAQNKEIPALRVHQWLAGWSKIKFDKTQHRSEPPKHFYMFTLPAKELRSLAGISRRQANSVVARAADLGIQRQHDRDRSLEIARFVEFGYPWSTLSEVKRKSEDYNDLRKPGWLPTAIVINILQKGTKRFADKSVAVSDLIEISENAGKCSVVLPYAEGTKSWHPSAIPPLEVIDGQHRLWAFDAESDSSFEVPVVAFHGLDISWQAYLFWTINIKPKRINPSLAFDLYPLLRAEDWLDRAEGHPVYRETRCQELTEALWSNSNSPWYDKINMLGEREADGVSQSAWIKSLMATFVKPWEGRKKLLGGLFGSRIKQGGEVLGWSRPQQAAFLLYIWQALLEAVRDSDKPWAEYLRKVAKGLGQHVTKKEDPAFYGEFSIIASDQGVRAYLNVINDMCFLSASSLKLNEWQVDVTGDATDEKAVSTALKSLKNQAAADFIDSITAGLASFDWRTSATPEIPEDIRRAKLVFRGSSGYKELRLQLLEHLKGRPGEVGKVATRLLGLV